MEIITVTPEQLKSLIKQTVTEVLDEKETRNKRAGREWITADEAIAILQCKKPTLRNFVDRDKAIRIDKVSERKTRYFREDCEKKANNPRYRYCLED